MSTTQASFYVTGGTLQSDAASYVRRRADNDLYDGLSQGKFCYVLTSRQMGKSSLMVSTAARLRAEGVTVAVIDLTAIGQNLTAEQWYDGLLNRIGRQLDLEDELEDFWDEHERMGPLQRWMLAVREVVLKHRQGRVVFFVDEIDVVRTLPFSTDEFFAGIREFYNRRTEDPELRRLTFCLLGVATPSDLIRDTRTTPFNIGQRIELADFTEEEAAPLAAGFGHADSAGRELLKRILYWTGGHPYLTQRLCQAVAEDQTADGRGGVDRLCESLFLSTRARERDDNLLFVRERILRSEVDRAGLLDLYLKAREHKSIRDDETNPLVSVLRLSGITRAVEGYLLVRNRIYYRVFDREWVVSNMPDAELRRQRAAYRRGVLRAASIAAVVLLLMTGLATWALSQKRYAEQQRERAEIERHRAELALAAAHEERERAVRMQEIAEKEEAEAEAQRKEAETQHEEAVRQKEVAERERAEAERQRQQAITAAKQREIAQGQALSAAEQAQKAAEEELRTRRLLYAVHMNQAQKAWDDANVGRVQKILGLYEPKQSPGDSAPGNDAGRDVRGFEWHYLQRLAHSDITAARARLPQPGEGYLTSFSRDGGRAAVASVEELASLKKATVKVWDLETRREVSTLKPHDKGAPSSLAVSPDGRVVASGHRENVLMLRDASTGEDLLTGEHKKTEIKPAAYRRGIRFRDPYITALGFSPDGRTIASGNQTTHLKGSLKLWDAATLRGIAFADDLANPITALAFSRDGRALVTGDAKGVLMVWQTPAPAETEISISPAAAFSEHEKPITFIAFSPDGKLLATGSEDNTVKLWDLTYKESTGPEQTGATRRLGPTLVGHTERITYISFSPDGKTLATGSADKTVKVWAVPQRAATGQPDPAPLTRELGASHGEGSVGWIQIASYALQSDSPSRMFASFFDPRNLIASAPPAFGISRLGSDASRPLNTFKGHDGSVLSVTFSADGETLTTLGADNNLRSWDTNAEPEWTNIGSFEGAVFGVAFSPDGKLLAGGATTSGDENVKLWDAATGRELRTFKMKQVNLVAFSHDGARLAAAGGTGALHIWNVATGEEIAVLRHPVSVFAVSFSPDGKYLVLGGGDGTAAVWDASTLQKIKTLTGHAKGIEAVPFSRDGRLLATASHDGTVKLWDVATWRELATVKADETGGETAADNYGVKAAAFSPDGRFLVTGGTDKVVKLWELADLSRPPVLLEGHSGPITFVAFSPDGRRVATSSMDETVRLWDVASEQEVAVLKGHSDDVWVAVFAPPHGETMATGGADGSVKLWRSQPGR